MTQSGLWDKTQQLSAAQRNAALAALVERGLIRAVRERTASRPRTVYFAAGWQAPALGIVPPAQLSADAPAVEPYDLSAHVAAVRRRLQEGEPLTDRERVWLLRAEDQLAKAS